MSASDIGRVVMRVTFPVEGGKVREFARAVHASNPVYWDLEVAAAAGFSAVPAPPTFTAVAAHYAPAEDGRTMSPARAAADALGLDMARTVNGEQTWDFTRIPQVGDRLSGTTVITDVQKKTGRRGGSLTLVTVVTTYLDDSAAEVVRETVTIIEKAQADRD
jgi:acyl dehydratase